MSDTGKIVSLVKALGGGSGGGSGLPTGGAPHQMLVTDAEGVAKWEDRTHYSEPNTQIVLMKEPFAYIGEGVYVLNTAPDVMPRVGAKYIVTFTIGDEEVSFGATTAFKTIDNGAGINGVGLGNPSLIASGDDTGDMYVIVLSSTEIDEGIYGMLGGFTDTVESIKVSVLPAGDVVKKIDEKYIPSNQYVITVEEPVTYGDGLTETECNRTYEEVLQAYKDGKKLVCEMVKTNASLQRTITFLHLNMYSEFGLTFDFVAWRSGFFYTVNIHDGITGARVERTQCP